MKTVRSERRPRHRARLCIVLLFALAAAFLPVKSYTAFAQHAAVPSASMEAVHASYLDVSANIADLRSRVTAWQGGDETSLNIAGEKLERIQAVLVSIAWPPAMAPAVVKIREAVDPVSTALQTEDAAMADAAVKALGDASHDLTHAFYGDWLPAVKGDAITTMAPHSSYLDISANIADLRKRIAQWQEGDESSLNIAKEKVDRIGVLLQHMSTFGVLAKPLQAMGAALPAIAAALDEKDPAAAQVALGPMAEASHNLTHDFYSWVDITAGPHDVDCIQASYLDLSLNLSDLRTRVGDWAKGDEAGLNIGQEKLDRIEAVLGHVTWPDSMAAAIAAIYPILHPLRQAFSDRNTAAAQEALKPLGDASHDVTHAYYGVWLPTAHSGGHTSSTASGMGNMEMSGASSAAPAASGSVQDESQPHSHGNAAPTAAPSTLNRGIALAGFAVVNILIIAAAGVAKVRAPRKVKASGASRVETRLEGASE